MTISILDLACKNCGCEYSVKVLNYSVVRCYNGHEVQMSEIECPACGSVSYSERYFDDPWDKE